MTPVYVISVFRSPLHSPSYIEDIPDCFHLYSSPTDPNAMTEGSLRHMTTLSSHFECSNLPLYLLAISKMLSI